MIQQLIRHGLIEDAYRELKPMVTRVQRAGDFHEWWSPDNQPRGSAQFRGSAGVLARSIEMLQTWAKQDQAVTQPVSAPSVPIKEFDPPRLTIAMWDFSWLNGHHRGGWAEDFDKVTDQLIERKFNTVRIDAFPLIIHDLVQKGETEYLIKTTSRAPWRTSTANTPNSASPFRSPLSGRRSAHSRCRDST